MLTRELELSGAINLPLFFGNRFKRLLPNSSLVLVVCLMTGLKIMNMHSFSVFAVTVKFATLFAGNYYFYQIHSDYSRADQVGEPSPILNFWSLAVEEQFYFLYPVLFTFLHAFLKISTAKMLFLFSVLILTSFLFSAYSSDRAGAFFLIYGRAWQLLLGASVSLFRKFDFIFQGQAENVIGIAGLTFILGAASWFNEETAHPGCPTLVPVCGTVLVLLVSSSSVVAKILSTDILTFLGDRSYSIYLWHYPCIIFSTIVFRQKFNTDIYSDATSLFAVKLVSMLASLPIACVAYESYENPVRRFKINPFISLVITCCTVCGVLIFASVSKNTSTDQFTAILSTSNDDMLVGLVHCLFLCFFDLQSIFISIMLNMYTHLNAYLPLLTYLLTYLIRLVGKLR